MLVNKEPRVLVRVEILFGIPEVIETSDYRFG